MRHDQLYRVHRSPHRKTVRGRTARSPTQQKRNLVARSWRSVEITEAGCSPGITHDPIYLQQYLANDPDYISVELAYPKK